MGNGIPKPFIEMKIRDLTVLHVSMLTREEPCRQRVELLFDSDSAGHVVIKATQGKRRLLDTEIAILSGKYRTFILLEPPPNRVKALIEVFNLDGENLIGKAKGLPD